MKTLIRRRADPSVENATGPNSLFSSRKRHSPSLGHIGHRWVWGHQDIEGKFVVAGYPWTRPTNPLKPFSWASPACSAFGYTHLNLVS